MKKYIKKLFSFFKRKRSPKTIPQEKLQYVNIKVVGKIDLNTPSKKEIAKMREEKRIKKLEILAQEKLLETDEQRAEKETRKKQRKEAQRIRRENKLNNNQCYYDN